MLPYILTGIAVALVLFIIFVATRPGDFRVTRTGSIAAAPSVVFGHINDLHKFQDWSPWAKLDPNAVNTFDGPGTGTGAAFKWSGNRNVGEGIMTITHSRPPDFVQCRLEFLKPFKCTNTAEFTLKPDGDQTALTWTTFGKLGFVSKLFMVFMNCDKMLGGQFEQGFKNLNAVVSGTTA